MKFFMRLLQNVSIQRKQMLIIMLTSTVALLLAGLIFLFYDIGAARKEIVKKVSVLAAAIGDNCSATIEFNDPKTAEETLSALRAEPSVVSACIYNSKGEQFATYHRSDDATMAFPKVSGPGYKFEQNRLYLFHGITQDGEKIGTIFVASDLTELHDRLARYPLILGEMLVAALLVALVLSSRLHRIVSNPILHLAQVARAVALDKNYSIRAQKQTGDELGQLIDGFNDMLTQIQERDDALRAARDTMELRVKERTEELRQSQALYHSLVEHLPVHVYRKDEAGRFIFVNSHFCQFLGIKAEQILGRTGEEITPDKETAERYSRVDKKILQTGAPIELEEDHADSKGNMKYLQVIRSPVFSVDGKVVGTQGMSFDITERKEAEAKLNQAHKELVAASRHAGMAEVATNVLHNVGNVLNSVNVAASVISDKLRNSKASGIARLVELMQAHPHDLGEFITRDPKGVRIPVYLEQLAGHLAEEQAVLLKEIDTLRRHVEHINEIVSMQQGYAKFAGVTEVVQVATLVDDALRMNAGALARHDVQLVREFDPHVPDINVEKHKVLQILVNLIRNAKYACEESREQDRCVTIRVTNGDDRVRVSVADNGVGIPKENLTRIFNHGFTTRKTGHGFGLHSGALAAKEMGGSLLVHSEGPGKGAIFTLELPLKPVKRREET
jgi:PAS domain S-box-containing protein